MIIGSAAALRELGEQLQAAGNFQPMAAAGDWPAQVAVLNSESPYLDCPDYRVSFHIQREPLPATLVRKSRQAPSAALFWSMAVLALVGLVSLVRWALNAL